MSGSLHQGHNGDHAQGLVTVLHATAAARQGEHMFLLQCCSKVIALSVGLHVHSDELLPCWSEQELQVTQINKLFVNMYFIFCN